VLRVAGDNSTLCGKRESAALWARSTRNLLFDLLHEFVNIKRKFIGDNPYLHSRMGNVAATLNAASSRTPSFIRGASIPSICLVVIADCSALLRMWRADQALRHDVVFGLQSFGDI
jgi:hypothetical protein